MKFYLGTMMVHWLWTVDVPLFISTRRLERNKKLKPALQNWALDSGGFTELSTYGHWTVTPKEYVTRIRRYQEHMGRLNWCAQQDWMCEDFIIEKTGLSVKEHQRRTVDNFLELKSLAPDIPFAPVIQGFLPQEYDECIELFDKAGIDLRLEPIVGIGSICRRQSLDLVAEMVSRYKNYGISLHGFGVKKLGLRKMHKSLTSADSLAWSFNARRNPPIEGHTHSHCGSCLEWALRWRSQLLEPCGMSHI